MADKVVHCSGGDGSSGCLIFIIAIGAVLGTLKLYDIFDLLKEILEKIS